MTQADFIKRYKYYALVTSEGGLFPSVKLAQAALESSWGKSELSVLYNNFFGIKAGSKWKGAVANMNTLEYYGTNVKPANVSDFFRVYVNDPWFSFQDHTKLLTQNSIYARALAQDNPISQAVELQAAGYATDPNYAYKVSQIITEHNLFELDKKKEQMKTINIAIAALTVVVSILVIYKTVKTV